MATPAQQLPRYRHRPARTPGWASAQHVYRPRRPTTTPLYPVVQHHLETFLAQATETDPMGYGVPSWVEKDLRAYLRCGILAHGFARVRCEDCGHERLLAFSCKGRGVCDENPTVTMATLNGIEVTNGQVIDLRVKSEKSEKRAKSQKSGKSEKPMRIDAPSFVLLVECIDAAGNRGWATATPEVR